MSCAVGEGGARLDAGTTLRFLGICTGLASTATGSGTYAVFGVLDVSSSPRSCLDFAAVRFDFLLVDLDGEGSLYFSLTVPFFCFTFDNCKIKITLFKSPILFIKSICFCAELCINGLSVRLQYNIVIDSIF